MTSDHDTKPPRKTRPRRMAREPDNGDNGNGETGMGPCLAQALRTPLPRMPSKLDMLEALLLAPDGATIAELMEATGWQQHSVRGAMAGALRKRGLSIASDKTDGLRSYRAGRPA